jgi:serine protease inhibitor
MRNIVYCGLSVLCFSVIACSNPAEPGADMRPLSSLEKTVVDAAGDFGVDLFQEIVRQEPPNTNLFISPLSVSYALGMTLNGAAGSTWDGIAQTLRLQGLSQEQINESYLSLMQLLTSMDPKVTFEIANSIWYRQGWTFRDVFLNSTRNYFDAEVTALDFSGPDALGIINGWVDDKTYGRIPEIIDQISPQTVMFLINALYFKGKWLYEFDPDDTRTETFTKSDGSTVSCQMMLQYGDLEYVSTSGFQSVNLPYGDGGFSMAVILPNHDNTVATLVADLDNVLAQVQIADFNPREMELGLPKFTLEYELTMNDVLKAMGMDIAFTNMADFTGMYEPGGLYISEVKHKTFVKVDEEGTEAAAVTSVEIREVSMPPMILVNRPFLFVIRETQSDGIIFIGKVEEPGE